MHQTEEGQGLPVAVSGTVSVQVIKFDNCYSIMLNATSLIQPLDQGFISMVQSRYRKWYLKWMLAQGNLANGLVDEEQQAPSDSDEERDDKVVPVQAPSGPVHVIKPSVRRGIRKVAQVWANLEPVRI